MYTIRSYDPKDADAVWTLHKVSVTKNNSHLPASRYEDLRDIGNAYLQANGQFLLAVSADGQLIGMGGVRRQKQGQAEINHLRVHPGFQKQGIGAGILKQLEQFAREHQCAKTTLSVLLGQTDTQRFFLRNGYYFVRRDVLDGMDVVFFEKQLDWQRETT
ncbi:MAG: GNAT family N-acetyltransferase [Anaerolineales bacterium]|nr:GNAT family N-acetyltransferase [Anaerolineales bacterium]